MLISLSLLLVFQILTPRLIPVKQSGIDMPLAPAQQPVQGARLSDGQVRPTEDTSYEDHGILPLELRVMDLV